MWTIDTKDFHFKSAVKVFEHQGVPVLIKTGGYPNATRNDGVKLRDVPHVQINVMGGSFNGKPFFSGLYVFAQDKARMLYLINRPGGLGGQDSPDALIEEGMGHLDEAVALLARLPTIYQEAEARMAQARPYASKDLTRVEYEQATSELRVKCWDDADMTSYGLKYGDFRFPDNTADYCVEITLASARRRGWLKEQPKKEAKIPQDSVKAWGQSGVRYDEACEGCKTVSEIDNNTALCRKCSTLQGTP